jgi:hypothetical protein
MQNEYTCPEIIEIGQAQFVIQGAKGCGPFDQLTGDENTPGVCDLQTDIDE